MIVVSLCKREGQVGKSLIIFFAKLALNVVLLFVVVKAWTSEPRRKTLVGRVI